MLSTIKRGRRTARSCLHHMFNFTPVYPACLQEALAKLPIFACHYYRPYHMHRVPRENGGIVDRRIFQLLFFCIRSLRLADTDDEQTGLSHHHSVRELPHCICCPLCLILELLCTWGMHPKCILVRHTHDILVWLVCHHDIITFHWINL